MLLTRTRSLLLLLAFALITPLAACGAESSDGDGGGNNGGNNSAGNNSTGNNSAGNNSTGNNSAGNNGGGEIQVDLGVPPETSINDLDDEDRAAICEAAAEYTASVFESAEYLELQCTLVGVAFGAFGGGDCAQIVQSCLQDPSQFELEESPEDADMDTCVEELGQDCDVTLQQLLDCQAEQIQLLRELSSTLTCSSDLQALDFELGPTCQAIEDQCPGFIEDDDDFEE